MSSGRKRRQGTRSVDEPTAKEHRGAQAVRLQSRSQQAGGFTATQGNRGSARGSAHQPIHMHLPAFSVPGAGLGAFKHVRDVHGHVTVEYGSDMVWYGPDEQVLALYVNDAFTASDSLTMLGLLKDIYRDGKSTTRSDSKTVPQPGLQAPMKMVMGGFREVQGNLPRLVFGWYVQPESVKEKQMEMASTFYGALEKHDVMRHVKARFRAGARAFNKLTDGYGLIPETSVTTISTTKDYESAWHLDQEDGPCGTAIGWFDDGEPFQGQGYFSAPFVLGLDKDGKDTVTLHPQSGSVLWINSTIVYHMSGACRMFGSGDEGGEIPYHRYGTAIACKPKVLNMAVKRMKQAQEGWKSRKQSGTYSRI